MKLDVFSHLVTKGNFLIKKLRVVAINYEK
jgi:hypothetical protein